MTFERQKHSTDEMSDLRGDNGEIFLPRRPLVEVVNGAWLLHYITGSVVEVSVSFRIL